MDLGPLSRKIKRVARDGLAARGIEVRRTDRGVRRTLPAILAHFRRLGLAPATVIDVGVGPGTPELYAGFPQARLMLVEPLEEFRGELEPIVKERPTQLVIAAAGPKTGEIQIAVHWARVCSSMLGSRRGDGEQPTRSVPMVRIDDLVMEHTLPSPFLIKIDVEGAELEVLKGALETLRETEMVLLETSLFELVPGTPLLHEVVAWMQQHGFVIADVYNGHNRPLDGSLAQLDIAFVQEDGRFRQQHAYATPAQASELYRSWGY